MVIDGDEYSCANVRHATDPKLKNHFVDHQRIRSPGARRESSHGDRGGRERDPKRLRRRSPPAGDARQARCVGKGTGNSRVRLPHPRPPTHLSSLMCQFFSTFRPRSGTPRSLIPDKRLMERARQERSSRNVASNEGMASTLRAFAAEPPGATAYGHFCAEPGGFLVCSLNGMRVTLTPGQGCTVSF